MGSGARRHTDKSVRLPDRVKSFGACPVCGKQMYASKKAAKVNARRLFPGVLMRVYQCGGTWHFTSQTTAQATKWRDHLTHFPGSG